MPVTRFATAGQIVKDAALELALGDPGDDPFASQDPAILQMIGHLKACGQDLCKRTEFTNLRSEWTFTTQAGDTGNYDLPADFLDIVDQTGWDRTRKYPLAGPLSSQEWQYLRSAAIGIPVYAMFRLDANQLRLFPQPPPAGIEITLEYKSSAWVIPAGKPSNGFNSLGPVDGDDTPRKAGDTCLFDPRLLVDYLKLKFTQHNGFDTTVAQNDFDDSLQRALGLYAAAPVLSLNGPRLGARLLDQNNLPLSIGGTSGGGDAPGNAPVVLDLGLT